MVASLTTITWADWGTQRVQEAAQLPAERSRASHVVWVTKCIFPFVLNCSAQLGLLGIQIKDKNFPKYKLFMKLSNRELLYSQASYGSLSFFSSSREEGRIMPPTHFYKNEKWSSAQAQSIWGMGQSSQPNELNEWTEPCPAVRRGVDEHRLSTSPSPQHI